MSVADVLPGETSRMSDQWKRIIADDFVFKSLERILYNLNKRLFPRDGGSRDADDPVFRKYHISTCLDNKASPVHHLWQLSKRVNDCPGHGSLQQNMVEPNKIDIADANIYVTHNGRTCV